MRTHHNGLNSTPFVQYLDLRWVVIGHVKGMEGCEGNGLEDRRNKAFYSCKLSRIGVSPDVHYPLSGLIHGFFASLFVLPKTSSTSKKFQSALKEPEIVDTLREKKV